MNTTETLTLREKALLVSNRLEVLTLNQVGSFEKHMLLCVNSTVDYEINSSDRVKYRRILASLIRRGIRHCEMLDIIYRILFEWQCIEDACLSTLIDWDEEEGESKSLELENFRWLLETTNFG